MKDIPFGLLVITRKDPFNADEELVFKTCASVIANIIKDIEINKIMNMQVSALQEGILDVKIENRKILEADKIKSDFLANVSHELRTPLNSIIGFSDLLSEGVAGTLNPKQKDFADEIRVAGLHLLGMINGILDISKLEANAMRLNPTCFPVLQVLNEAVNIVKPLAHKKNITLKINAEDFTIKADYQKIQQILFNLLSNSVKFSPEHETVDISAKSICGGIELCVKDNGAGVDKKYHAKIFRKFEQIHNPDLPSTPSTGLGLTITKALVKLHKGKIKLKSAPGEGAAFIVTLPDSKQPAKQLV
jgi:signal transduction histidine kinase